MRTTSTPTAGGVEESKSDTPSAMSAPALISDETKAVTAGAAKMLAQLSITSGRASPTTEVELTSHNSHLLLEQVVKGNEEKAKAMLDENPHLLLSNAGKTTDYSGKLITGLTAFQAALCAGDSNMVFMMQPYFDKLEEGNEQMTEQIQTIFNDGYHAHLDAQNEAVFDFTAVLDAIAKASDRDVNRALDVANVKLKQNDRERRKSDRDLTLTQAMNRFRETFAEKSRGEQIYNSKHLLKALKLYMATFETHSKRTWNLNKRDLFFRQIIGFCLRFVPAHTAQAFARGIYCPIPRRGAPPSEQKPFERSFTIREYDGEYYPLSKPGKPDLLGFKSGFYACEDEDEPVGYGSSLNSEPAQTVIKMFGKHFSTNSERICASVSPYTRPRSPAPHP